MISRIGTIGKPQGLRGYFFLGGRPDLLSVVPDFVWVKRHEADTNPQKADVTYHAIIRGRLVLGLSVISDRTDLEKNWMSCELLADCPVSLQEKLSGLEVIDPAGNHFGTVLSVENHGASDILQIQNGELCVEIPFVIPTFFDSSWETTGRLRLTVDSLTFEGLWFEQA